MGAIKGGTIMDYFAIFLHETRDNLQKRNWEDLTETVNKLEGKLTEISKSSSQTSLTTELLRKFIYSVSLGEVTKELFANNLTKLLETLDVVFTDPQTYLGLNYSPYLYLTEAEVNTKIASKFAQSLELTKELKEQTDNLGGMDLEALLKGLTGGFDPGKLPPKKRTSKAKTGNRKRK
jgi:hypothetical protein